MGAFGEKLRKQREQRGLALEAISNTTKISVRMLRALEEEHFDQLPGGVFNKGFVRAYSRQIGLDAEETVTDYLTALRESQIQALQILPDFRSAPDKKDEVTPRESRDAGGPAVTRRNDAGEGDNHGDPESRKANRGTSSGQKQKQTRSDRRRGDRRSDDAAVVAAQQNPDRDRGRGTKRRESFPAAPTFPTVPENSIGPTIFRFSRTQVVVPLLLIVIALAAWASRHHRGAAGRVSDTSKNSSSVPSPSTVVSSNPVSSNPVSAPSATMAPNRAPSLESTKAPSAATGKAASTANSTAGAKPAAEPASSETASITSSAPAPPDVSVTNHSVEERPIEPTAHSTAAKPPATFTVLIRADKTSWVQITADGKSIAQETLIAPAHTSIRATREIVIRTGNAAGISFLLNGKEIPAGGNEGEVKTYAFDATGVRVLSQAQTPATNR